MSHKQTPSQTVGPYFAYGLTSDQYGYRLKSLLQPYTTDDNTIGERIRVIGHVLDGNGNPVDDAMIESWQANAEGRYSGPSGNTGFKGFGRVGTGSDPENRFWFDTIKPGALEDGQAPHLNLIIFMRGLLSHVYTRIYFSDEIEANSHDLVLNAMEETRRATLVAKRQETPQGIVYHFDIHMQGDRETVFFDV